jgi:hypothetical protein
MERSEKATASMRTVDADIKEALVQIDHTSASLENLVKPGQSEVKKAFETYSDAVAQMEKKGRQLVKHTDQMIARRLDYFAEWEKEGNSYSNPEIRALSEQRRADLGEVFARIPAASVGIKGAFQAYLSDIEEIRKYLSNDLTPKGIESITPTALKSMRDGDALRNAVKPMVSAIDGARAEMAKGGQK